MGAHGHHYTSVDDPGPLKAPGLRNAGFVLIALGVVGFVMGLLSDDKSHAWAGLLQGLLIPAYIGLAALFYIAVHSVTGAVWMVPLRRLMEGLSAGIYLLPVLTFIVLLGGGNYLYDFFYDYWKGESAHAHLFHVPYGTKDEFSNPIRVYITTALYTLGWCFFRWRLVGLSIKQDSGADIIDTHKTWSIAFLLFFAPSITFYVWDLVLSLHINWFSTMFGVYSFASAMQTFLCTIILVALWLRRSGGPLEKHIGKHAIHDLGTWMVAWSCFCAYIGFSQYMLIYYANLDEETFFYVMRTQHGYGWQWIAIVLLRWPLVFLGLMSQSVRTNKYFLVGICSVVLVANWMDWSWHIMPAFSPNEYRAFWSPIELLIGAGCAGALITVAVAFWSKHGLLAKGDPRLLPSMNAEHLH